MKTGKSNIFPWPAAFLTSVLWGLVSAHALAQSQVLLSSIEPAAGLATLSDQLISETQNDQQGRAFSDLSQLLQKSFSQSPIPAKTRRTIAASEARIEEAQAAFLPRLSTSLGAGRTDYGATSSANGQGDRSINASQLIYDFGLSPALREAAEQRFTAAEQSARTEQSKLALSMLQAVLDWQRNSQALALAQAFVQTRQQFFDLTATRSREGMNSPFDVQRAKAKLLEAQDEVPGAQRRLESSATRLGELFGPQLQAASLPARFQLPQVPSALSSSSSLADNRSQAASTDVKTLSPFRDMQATSEALSKELRAEQSRLWGAFSAEASHSINDVGSSFERKRSAAIVVFRSELLSGFAQRARIRQAAERLGESKFELERLERELLARLQIAQQEWEASARIQATRRELLLEMRQAELSTRELFLFARASLTDVFRAQEDFMNAAQKLLQASFDRQQAWYQWTYHQDRLLDILAIRSP
ncbi:MAG: TolC family protein [Betaproteobacteria bacterium]|nr:TolC family protein [Betaproteobacteria bacterium]NBS39970.1 TolC family protein [Betaproteobacteria bacterium]NBT82264.1 TolC family protein [Betaproteobacteria bacterium]NCY08170.1 TolC family protein [Betaproteobacteria bacterium]NDC03544.1 TolC family protein [Betaproteobacteria bacterium]